MLNEKYRNRMFLHIMNKHIRIKKWCKWNYFYAQEHSIHKRINFNFEWFAILKHSLSHYSQLTTFLGTYQRIRHPSSGACCLGPDRPELVQSHWTRYRAAPTKICPCWRSSNLTSLSHRCSSCRLWGSTTSSPMLRWRSRTPWPSRSSREDNLCSSPCQGSPHRSPSWCSPLVVSRSCSETSSPRMILICQQRPRNANASTLSNIHIGRSERCA